MGACIAEHEYFAFVNFKTNPHLSLSPVRANCTGSLRCPQCDIYSQELTGACIRETGLKSFFKILFWSLKYVSSLSLRAELHHAQRQGAEVPKLLKSEHSASTQDFHLQSYTSFCTPWGRPALIISVTKSRMFKFDTPVPAGHSSQLKSGLLNPWFCALVLQDPAGDEV